MRSFSASAKAEICREFPQSGCCALAECFGILLFCNSFRNDSIKIITESGEFAALLPKLFKKAFGFGFDSPAGEGKGGKQIFQIQSAEKMTTIMNAFGFDTRQTFSLHINLPVVENASARGVATRQIQVVLFPNSQNFVYDNVLGFFVFFYNKGAERSVRRCLTEYVPNLTGRGTPRPVFCVQKRRGLNGVQS